MEERKENLIKIFSSAGLLAVALLISYVMFPDIPSVIKAFLFFPSYLVVGFDVIDEAFEKILKGKLLDESFLMTVATAGAMLIGDYAEAVFVMLFFALGETAEMYADNKSENSINALLSLRPDRALLETDGEYTEINAKEVKIGDIILVKPGERIPLDGEIIEGETFIDTSAVTGESVPKKYKTGNKVYSGCINNTSPIRVCVLADFGQSTASKILELCKNAREKKTKTEKFITRFARIYTPVVVGLAVLIALIPSIIFGNVKEHIYSALTFLIVSCPCALVISVPLSFFGALGTASKKGIIVKGSDCLEVFANLGTAVFDKTGTLTKGTFTVTAVHPNIVNEKGLLQIAASVEKFSNHPIAVSIMSFSEDTSLLPVTDVTEISGMGITAKFNDKIIYVGNEKLMEQNNILYNSCHNDGKIIHIAVQNEYLGHIVISDTVKSESKKAIEGLKSIGIKTVMLSGDSEENVKNIALALSFDRYYSSLLPEDKVLWVESIMKHERKNTVFIGDGINDAPVLSRADAGVAMGALGSDAAIDSADVCITDDNIDRINVLIKISKKAVKISKQNIVFSLLVKITVLILSALGINGIMWLAAFADVGVLILAVLNSMRTLKI